MTVSYTHLDVYKRQHMNINYLLKCCLRGFFEEIRLLFNIKKCAKFFTTSALGQWKITKKKVFYHAMFTRVCIKCYQGN